MLDTDTEIVKKRQLCHKHGAKGISQQGSRRNITSRGNGSLKLEDRVVVGERN